MSDKYTLHHGDCLEVMAGMEANSVDTVITDPPAGISFMNKKWDSDKGGRDAWIAWLTEVMTECYRVMKPGAMLLCWSIPRTSHWTGMAIENAGFEVRDIVHHIFGSGFPKSLDIGKSLDKRAGVEREVVGTSYSRGMRGCTDRNYEQGAKPYKNGKPNQTDFPNITAPATPETKTWDGYGTALKPAVECWWLAMKPLDGTFAENALKWGCAGLNVDGARIEAIQGEYDIRHYTNEDCFQNKQPKKSKFQVKPQPKGRWPANLILSDDPEVTAGFPVTSGNEKKRISNRKVGFRSGKYSGQIGYGELSEITCIDNYGDSGSAARYFYCAKASKSERNHGLPDGMTNKHPTVKSLSLMEYLCTLTRTPTGGLVLDPFCGSGTTGVAAIKTGRDFIGIDQDADSIEVAGYRLAAAVEETAVIQMELELDGN